jgi:hypothetical protein
MQIRQIRVAGSSGLFVTAFDLLGPAPRMVLNGGDRMNPQQQAGVMVNVDQNGGWQIQWSTVNADTRQPSGADTTEIMDSMTVLDVT